jgi:hypothetical protein
VVTVPPLLDDQKKLLRPPPPSSESPASATLHQPTTLPHTSSALVPHGLPKSQQLVWRSAGALAPTQGLGLAPCGHRRSSAHFLRELLQPALPHADRLSGSVVPFLAATVQVRYTSPAARWPTVPRSRTPHALTTTHPPSPRCAGQSPGALPSQPVVDSAIGSPLRPFWSSLTTPPSVCSLPGQLSRPWTARFPPSILLSPPQR